MPDAKLMFMTPGDVAKLAGVTPMAVQKWAQRGDLTPAARTEGGIKLFRPKDVHRWLGRRAQRKKGAPG